MAFHPFRHFRKHQKKYLAVLTILTMFIFVFTGFASRGADPVTLLLHWFGGGRHGEEVLPLYGKTTYDDDLDKIRKHRQLANEFLVFGIAPQEFDRFELFQYGFVPPGGLLGKAIDDLRKKTRTGESEVNPVKEALATWQSIHTPQTFSIPREQRTQITLRILRQLTQNADTPGAQKDAELVRALDTLTTALSIEAWCLNQQPNLKDREYFLGGTSRLEDLLDFIIWKHQADKLGIVLTPADVCREVNRVWGNREAIKPGGKFDANDMVRQYFGISKRIHKDLTPRDLLSALTDEFRVALAKEALLGQGPGYRFYRNECDGIHYSPTVATPDEFFKYFQEQRTTLAVSLLPLDVERFVDKVAKKPNDDDLQNLYAKYKDREPSPSSREPGFKEPRRIKVQYFNYSADSPFYKKLAARATELLPLYRLVDPANTYPAGGGWAAWAVNLAVPLAFDTGILAQYDSYLNEESRRVTYDHFGAGFDLYDRKAVQLQAPAATLGQLVGVVGTGGTLLSVPVSYLATTEISQKATFTAFASTVLADASSSPLQAMTLPMPFLYSAQSFEAVKDKLREQFQKVLARSIIHNNFGTMKFGQMGTVEEEMQKLFKKTDKKEFQTYINKVVKDYGVQNFHSMSATQTKQEITDKPDPALKLLKEAYENAEEDFIRQMRGQKRPDFVTALFETDPRQQSLLFSPDSQFTLKTKDETYLFWRAEDIAAHVRPFTTIEAEVKKAWYFEQARRLARDEAKRIQAALKEQHLNPTDAVKFLREQKQGDVFELTNVAHLVTPIFGLPGHKFTPSDFRPYQPPKDRIAYPPADFVTQLLALKQPGDSLILTDQPVDHIYVAVLMEKPQQPQRREFYEIYSQTQPEDPIWGEMMKARRLAYERELIEQLRADATKKLEGGEYIISDNIRSRYESGTNDSGE